MARPAKSHLTIVKEGRGHRTKAELQTRKNGEESLATGIKFLEKKEVKNDAIAHKEFMRVKKLFETLGKNDGLFENAINRYCQMYSECYDFEIKREEFFNSLAQLNESWNEEKQKLPEERAFTVIEYLKTRTLMQGQVINLDKQIMQKRKMLLDIEKENLMTIAAALRSIPKKEEEKDDPHAGMFG